MPLFGKKPSSNIPAIPSGELKARLLGLNRATSPYRIVDGQAEGVDLVAEWKIVEPSWYKIFEDANLEKVFQIHMKLDAEKSELRAQDREYSLSWSAGIPQLTLEASAFKGQMTSMQFGTAYAFTEALAPGQVYKYRFNTNELKKPIQEICASSGWGYKGVAFGKL